MSKQNLKSLLNTYIIGLDLISLEGFEKEKINLSASVAKFHDWFRKYQSLLERSNVSHLISNNILGTLLKRQNVDNNYKDLLEEKLIKWFGIGLEILNDLKKLDVNFVVKIVKRGKKYSAGYEKIDLYYHNRIIE